MKKIAINGFGRIGRAFFRAVLKRNALNALNGTKSDIKISHIYDVKNFEILAYLLKHDSLLGEIKGDIEFKKNTIFLNGDEIKITDDFSGADIVVECSGANLDCDSLQKYLQNGAKRVILSAPPKDNMPIFIYGVNWDKYRGEAIFSAASCTSNAIAPVIFTISKKYKIFGGNISTIHPFNSDQNLLDNPNFSRDLRLSRNATQNIIPTSSSIGAVLARIFGDLSEFRGSALNFYGDSIRVPTSLVCFSNVDLLLDSAPKIDEILELNFNPQIIAFDSKSRVSSDFVGDSHSAIIAKDLIKTNGKILRIPLWFDNENGYANRLCDIISEI
ncbi:glyceraldehyde 3-phosphate dehydrogenase NAD-binding domain-containing protein [Helicobacter sp. 23-1045]